MRKRARSPWLVMILACAAAGSDSRAVAAPMFTGLGTSQSVTGISADGSVVVGHTTASGSAEAYRWSSATGIVELGYLPGKVVWSEATGVSADGSVVVGSSGSSNSYFSSEAFRWTSAGGMAGLATPSGFSRANGVSADGSVIVGEDGPGAFRWTSAGGRVGLGSMPGGGNTVSATGVSADGSVIVGFGGTPLGYEAFRWTSSGGVVGLGDLPGGAPGGLLQNGFGSHASAVSADGSAVVGYSYSANGTVLLGDPEAGTNDFVGTEAFLWTENGGMVGLGDLTGGIFHSTAYGISGDGSVVVGGACSAVPGCADAFIWDAELGMRSLKTVLIDLGLDLTGWTLTEAAGISADGSTIFGHAWNPSGVQETWIAVIPEPDTGLLVMAGLVGLACLHRPGKQQRKRPR